jgi:hypothetical protein
MDADNSKRHPAGRAMSRVAFVAVLALAVAFPAPVAPQATRLSIDQLSQLLDRARGEKDAKLARQLSTLVLTQRASAAALSRWLAEFPGRHTRLALTELADSSAFLAPPSSDIAPQPQPSLNQMTQILVRSINYVAKIMPRLPDFYAVRTTTHFEDKPEPDLIPPCTSSTSTPDCTAAAPGKIPAGPFEFAPLQVARTSRVFVSYRDGHEMINQRAIDILASRPSSGLETNGEFGPILSVVLRDAAHGEIDWRRWERGATGPLAVFAYSVPEKESDYEVGYLTPSGVDTLKPAYHGEFSIDPVTGTILRITIISDLQPPHQDLQTGIMVEYGPVTIGDRPYFCPVHGVAYSVGPVYGRGAGKLEKLPLTQIHLNDISFARYHLFRAEVKILPDAGAASSH